MRPLYAQVQPYRRGYLPVSDRHRIYFEESGNKSGKPTLFIHGGPGGGTSSRHRRFFDPSHYRIVLFDQRGCGRSEPHACLKDNTTWDLVQDIEMLRRHLGVESWQLFGGSWGSALALAYAETYPTYVREMILRGVFLLRRKELHWFYQEGASLIFPDAWEGFVGPIPEDERSDLIGAYHKRLTSEDGNERLAAARAWCAWEKSTSYLEPRADEVAKAHSDDRYALAFSRIECHYFMHGGFFSGETQLLDGIGSIRHIPCVIVQGRYDLVCPMVTSWELHRAWPEADFRVVPVAGHSAFESAITHELVEATDRFR